MVLQSTQRIKTIEFIPDKCLLSIISKLDLNDLRSLSITCERMYHIIKNYLQEMKEKNKIDLKQERFSNYRNANPKIVQKIMDKYPSLAKKKKHVLKETRCLLCGNIKREILLRPCNHLIYCEKCASKLDKCFECGVKIEQKEIVNWKPGVTVISRTTKSRNTEDFFFWRSSSKGY
eukprot:TRINITY_DN853_c0_g1_i1.p1 TRINITY_DN853_c0_g1~~TRINITY_DN853_c0_g1_i1.p1  ORF type:complete len:176 (+),score=48.43 TRINITY_DN853_c0_g1_i1:111-638(+)